MIGGLWFLAQVAAIGIIAIGVLAQSWVRWLRQPWWWAVVIGMQANASGRFAGHGRWGLAATCALGALSAAWFMAVCINDRRKAATRYERWDPML